MSRFLARAMATVRAEGAAIAGPAPSPRALEPGFGGFGGFGERAENENTPSSPAPLPAFDWPDGVDYWLTHDAVKLAGILHAGGSYRWCPTGGLDVWREDGRYVGFGPRPIAAMRAAGLLPRIIVVVGVRVGAR